MYTLRNRESIRVSSSIPEILDVTIDFNSTNVSLSSSLWTDFTPYNDVLSVGLANNFLTEIKHDDFAGLEDSVVFLDLRRNRIGQIETGAFESLRHLCTLNLKHNKIHHVEENVFVSSTLRGLHRSFNRVQELESNAFSSLESLVALNLDGNDLYVVY